MEDKYNVFIYCSGKSGSSTLHETLKQAGFNSLHSHSDFYYQNHLRRQESIFKVIERSKQTYDKIYIIDSYRTPIERRISSFFQNLHIINRQLYDKIENNEIDDNLIKTLIEMIDNYDMEEYHSINEVLDYFQIPRITTFDFDKKYHRIDYENIVFIKLLFKHIDNWDKILTEIFNTKIKVVSDNISESKVYNKVYKHIKQNYKPPEVYMTNILPNDVEFKIFNTEEEQKIYITKYT